MFRLRKLEEKDVPEMIAWMYDPKVNCKFRFDFASMTEDKALEFVKNSFTDENQNFAFVGDDDRYLGTISLKNISKVDNNAEYAVVTSLAAQGTGAAFAATKAILKYAFETLGLNRVYLNVLVENERANAFYKKCGFEYEGMFKKHLCIRGQYKDLNWYGMTKEQYMGMKDE